MVASEAGLPERATYCQGSTPKPVLAVDRVAP